MSLFQCRECKNEISSEAMQCPHCGSPVDTEIEMHRRPARLRNRRVFHGGLLVAVIGIGVIVYLLYRNDGLVRGQIDAMVDWCQQIFHSHREIARAKI